MKTKEKQGPLITLINTDLNPVGANLCVRPIRVLYIQVRVCRDTCVRRVTVASFFKLED
jgi:hypothetical protein